MPEENNNWTKPLVAAGLSTVVIGGLGLGGAFSGDDTAGNAAMVTGLDNVNDRLDALDHPETLTQEQVKTIISDELEGFVVDVDATDFVLDHEDKAIAITMEEMGDEIEDIFDFLNDQRLIDIDDQDDVEIEDHRDWDVNIESRRNGDYEVEGQVKVTYLNGITGDERTRWLNFELTIEDGRVKGDIDYDLP